MKTVKEAATVKVKKRRAFVERIIFLQQYEIEINKDMDMVLNTR